MVGAAIVVALVGVVIGGAWMFQRSLIYLPDRAAPPPASGLVVGARDVTLRTADGLDLVAWYAPADPACGVTVLLAPGNAGNRVSRAELMQGLIDRGLGVLALEYRGYGGNPGAPAETGLRLDARAALAFLDDAGVSSDTLLYAGESLGAAVVADLAAEHPPSGLLLRSPFTSLADAGRANYGVPVGWLLSDRFDVVAAVSRVSVPVRVVLGDADRIVPAEQSLAVAQAARAAGSDVAATVVDGADHNDPALVHGRAVLDAASDLADATGAGHCR